MRNPPRTVKGMQRLINNIDHTLQVRKANRIRGQNSAKFQSHKRKMGALMREMSAAWKDEKRTTGVSGIAAYRAFVSQRLKGQKDIW